MVLAIDNPTPESCNLEPDVAAEKKPDAEMEKTVEELLALAKDGVFPKEAECISPTATRVIEYMITTGGLSFMERDSDNATILTVAATHKRRELCDYLLGTSDGRALFFDLANSEDTRPEDEARKLMEEKRRSTGQGSTDAGGEEVAFEPEPLPVERLMGMDNPVLLQVFLDNVRRYNWASDCFTLALEPVLDRCLKIVDERKDSYELFLFGASVSVVEGTGSIDEHKRIMSIHEMLTRLAGQLRATLCLMINISRQCASEIPLNELQPGDLERPWDEVKRENLAAAAIFLARSAENRDLLKWILDDYGESFEVWMLYAIMEAVVLGYRGVETVEELMMQQVTEGEDRRVQDRRAFFEEVVVGKWDGDAGTLVGTFKAAYLKAVFLERWKDLKEVADAWTSNRKAALLSDEGWEERLDMIKM
ncbi:hypothetical protein HK101_006182, partial [Irineochytrium annulatum]